MRGFGFDEKLPHEKNETFFWLTLNFVVFVITKIGKRC